MTTNMCMNKVNTDNSLFHIHFRDSQYEFYLGCGHRWVELDFICEASLMVAQIFS